MKRINIFIGVLILLITSCEKVLDVEPKQSIDANGALTDDRDVNALVIGGYSVMAGGSLYGTNLLMMPDLLGSDEVCSWRGTFQSPREIANKSMTRDNTDASLVWTAAYNTINIANTTLENLNLVKDTDLKTRLEGEAYFMRGIMHFELLRLYALPWGATTANTHLGVVIKTKSTKDETEAFEKLPRNTVKEVYDFVITDLTKAVDLLPEQNLNRASKYAALAFLSRVYLQQQNYPSALATANSVIESGLYKMNADILTAFNNDNTSETIWEIQQNEQNNAGTANNGMATFYSSLKGIGRADVRIVADFVDSQYPDGDTRKEKWYYIGVGARSGNTYCAKWSSFSQNLPVIRIAEMYLTRAECNTRLSSNVGDTPARDFAQIKSVGRTNSSAPLVLSLDNIIKERFIELAFEGQRIHDLRRLRMSTGDYQWNANELVFPIPQREVDATEGILIQNPGY